MGSYWTTPAPPPAPESHPGWDDMPDEIKARILELRYEMMLRDKRQREQKKILEQFWDKIWRARLRVFKRRLPQETQ
jgi:hypothetical protein